MDKYEYQIEQLAQRVRRLEADSLSGDESREAQALMEDLDLIPASGQDAGFYEFLSSHQASLIMHSKC